jgi:hypothetical protein
MRYYDFVLNTDADYIIENAKIKLSDYAYKNPIGQFIKELSSFFVSPEWLLELLESLIK